MSRKSTRGKRSEESFDPGMYYWHCRQCGPVENNAVRSDQVCPDCGVQRVIIKKARSKK